MTIRVLFASAVNPVAEVQNRYRPLWPAYLAGYLEKQLGGGLFEFRYARGAMEEEIRFFKPDVVGISSVTQNYNYAIEYARVAKKHGRAVIIGGMHITSLPECLTKNMDAGCIGEGEVTFLELMRQYLELGDFRRENLAKINGLVYHDGEKLVTTPDRSVIASLNEIPHPRRSLLGYAHRGYVSTARGCPYDCVFCACTRYWGKVRYTSAEYIIEEIQELIENKVKIIRFSDDNFAANLPRLREVSDLIVERGYNQKVKFSCWSRANDVTAEVVERFKAMNMVSVKMGLESGVQRTLDYLKGNVTVEDNSRAINLLKDAGIQANGDFIIGAPDETEEEILQTYDFIRDSHIDYFDVNIFSPLPGTPVWEYAMKKHPLGAEVDWNRFNFKFNLDKTSAIVLSNTLSYDQLCRLYKKFRVLRFFKALKATLATPWRHEVITVSFKKLVELLASKRDR